MKVLKVVKIGGNVIDDQEALSTFLKDFSQLEGSKILVHGGGKLATRLAEQMNVSVKMIEGRRITDAETLDIITMVYAGKINKNIVAQLQKYNCNAIGFTGADGNSIVSHKREIKAIDYEFVGDVDKVNPEIISVLLDNNVTPVFCAITHDQNGQLLNTNADTIASELAIGLSELYEVELHYCFEKNGVLADINDDNSVVEDINQTNYQELKEEGVIADGMIPKLDNCFHAIEHKVGKVCIGKPEMLFKKNIKHTIIQ
ncbi:acetylglutamate kinase [Flavobacteriaceae sp. LMIT009]